MRFFVGNDPELRLVISKHTDREGVNYYRASLKRNDDSLLISSIEDRYPDVISLLDSLSPFIIKIADDNITIVDE